MIQSSQITMYLDGIATPLHDPMFGVSHQSDPGSSFEQLVDAGAITCLTVTDEDKGSTRSNINSATSVKFVVSTSSGDVELNGSVFQIDDAFGGTHYSLVFLVS